MIRTHTYHLSLVIFYTNTVFYIEALLAVYYKISLIQW